MAQFSQPTQFINYISEFKKCFVTRNNGTIQQTFKIDSEITDTYYFQFVNNKNQIVSLSGRTFNIFGSWVDAKAQTHLLFETDNGTIDTENNILSFRLNTYTSQYLANIKTTKECNITIVETTGGDTQVVLRDKCLCYKRPIQEEVTPTPVVAGFGLEKNGYVMSLTGTVLSGDNETIAINDNTISLIAPIPSAVSQLVNDVPYVTSSDSNFIVSTMTAGDWPRLKFNGSGPLDFIKLSWFPNDMNYTTWNSVQDMLDLLGYLTAVPSTYALKTDIPTNISQLTNDEGFITGYIAGSGISIDNGVISCTGGGGGGATYTAGEGIGIDSNNVISLTATIPSAVSQLTNDAGYITHVTLTGYGYVNGYYNFTTQNYGLKYNGTVVNVSWLPNDAGYITNAALTDYALKSEIPLSTSQLTNDSQYMSYSTFSMYGGNGISVYHDVENDDWIISWLYGDIIAGYGLSSTIDEYRYLHLSVNESALTGISIDNQQKMLIDNEVKNSSFVLGYNKDYDIFTNIIETNDGVLNINPLSGIEDIEEGKTATFEHWITPSGSLTGIVITNGTQLIGDLPDSFTSGSTQVFTRRVISKNNNKIQQISYAYEFEDAQSPVPPTPPTGPLTIKAKSGDSYVSVNSVGSPDFIQLYYKKTGDSGWTNLVIDQDTIYLQEGEQIIISGINDFFSKGEEDYYKIVSQESTAGAKQEVYGNINSLINGSTTLSSFMFSNLFNSNSLIEDASGLVLIPDTAESCYRGMFYSCTNLLTIPQINISHLAQYSCGWMFSNCSNISSNVIISASTIDSYACKNMFQSCSNISSVTITASEVGTHAFDYGFFGCASLTTATLDCNWANNSQNNCEAMFMYASNLSSITVTFTDWGSPVHTNGWVAGVAGTGTFTKPSALSETYGDDNIPTGWTVVNV